MANLNLFMTVSVYLDDIKKGSGDIRVIIKPRNYYDGLKFAKILYDCESFTLTAEADDYTFRVWTDNCENYVCTSHTPDGNTTIHFGSEPKIIEKITAIIEIIFGMDINFVVKKCLIKELPKRDSSTCDLNVAR
jgi:hypothetical protein